MRLIKWIFDTFQVKIFKQMSDTALQKRLNDISLRLKEQQDKQVTIATSYQHSPALQEIDNQEDSNTRDTT